MLVEEPMESQKLIIFVKAPRPGLVKTRLALAIGMSEAAEAYRRLVDSLLGHLAGLPGTELRFSPDDAFAEIQPWLRKEWQARPQGSGDLGQRLNSAFLEAFTAGKNRVVIIGSDCPEVRAEDIDEAWTALASNDVVIGPATDGGYWLIGLRQPAPELFQNVSWSRPSVFQETIERAKAAQLRVHLLRQLTDVDTAAEWSAFMAGFKGS